MAAKKKSTVAPDTMLLKPSEATQALTHATLRKMPIFLWGPPGIGKSQIMAQIAKDLGFNFVDIRLSQLDPTDLRGIPYPGQAKVFDVDGKPVMEQKIDHNGELIFEGAENTPVMVQATENAMFWSPPHFYERNPKIKTLYFFDEMNAAAQSIQAAAYQIILDRKMGDYKLGPDDVVFAAGNRETDKGATFKMPTPLMNRFVHLEMKHDFEDWQDWAIDAGIHKTVVGYLTWQKHELMNFDASSASRGFATPRSWEFVSRLVDEDPNLPEMVKLGLLAGAVGDGVAIKFIEYQRMNDKLPNPSDILSGKVKELKSDQKEISIMYALTVGLCYELRDAFTEANEAKKAGDAKKHDAWVGMCDNFFQFMMDNFQPEMTILGARTILSNFKLKIVPAKMKSWKPFAKRHNTLILDN